MSVEKVLNSRERFKKSNPDEKKTEYLVKLLNVKYADKPESKWILEENFPEDEQSQAALKQFKAPSKKRKKSESADKPVEKRQKIDCNKENEPVKLDLPEVKNKIDEEVSKTDDQPVDEPVEKPVEKPIDKPVEIVTTLPKPLTEVPPGQCIVPGVNKPMPIKLGPKILANGKSYTITNGVAHGYRVIKDVEYDVHTLVDVTDETKRTYRKWLSVYDFDQNSRTSLAPRSLSTFRDSVFEEIIDIKPCRDTFIIEGIFIFLASFFKELYFRYLQEKPW